MLAGGLIVRVRRMRFMDRLGEVKNKKSHEIKKPDIVKPVKDHHLVIGRINNLTDFFKNSTLGEISFERNKIFSRPAHFEF